MLRAPAPFPYVGSHALFEDHDGTHLVRICYRRWHGGDDGYAVAMVAFPLREGATGNREVPESELIDGTTLDAAERRRLADLERELTVYVPPQGCARGTRKLRRLTSPRLKALGAELQRLKRRALYAPILEQRLRQLNTPWHREAERQRKVA
jgi:hypothetical protein